MTLDQYFKSLSERIEASEEIQNDGKDADGFYKPTRSLLLQKLMLLRDLHANPRALPMVKDAWQFVVANLPPEYLVMDAETKDRFKRMLASS